MYEKMCEARGLDTGWGIVTIADCVVVSDKGLWLAAAVAMRISIQLVPTIMCDTRGFFK